MSRALTALTTLLLLAGCAQRAAPVAAPPPPPVATNVAQPNSRGPPFVVTTPQPDCRQPPRDGDTVLRFMIAFNQLTPRLQADPAYGGAWYDYAPCYRIVLAFTDSRPRPWVIEAAAPELRPYIAFAQVKYSLAERDRARLEIMAPIGAVGIEAVFVDGVNERFAIGVTSEADAQLARSVIPTRYLPDVRIFVGDIRPRPERR